MNIFRTCKAVIFSPMSFLRLRWNCVILRPWEDLVDWFSFKPPHLNEALCAICKSWRMFMTTMVKIITFDCNKFQLLHPRPLTRHGSVTL